MEQSRQSSNPHIARFIGETTVADSTRYQQLIPKGAEMGGGRVNNIEFGWKSIRIDSYFIRCNLCYVAPFSSPDGGYENPYGYFTIGLNDASIYVSIENDSIDCLVSSNGLEAEPEHILPASVSLKTILSAFFDDLPQSIFHFYLSEAPIEELPVEPRDRWVRHCCNQTSLEEPTFSGAPKSEESIAQPINQILDTYKEAVTKIFEETKKKLEGKDNSGKITNDTNTDDQDTLMDSLNAALTKVKSLSEFDQSQTDKLSRELKRKLDDIYWAIDGYHVSFMQPTFIQDWISPLRDSLSEAQKPILAWISAEETRIGNKIVDEWIRSTSK